VLSLFGQMPTTKRLFAGKLQRLVRMYPSALFLPKQKSLAQRDLQPVFFDKPLLQQIFRTKQFCCRQVSFSIIFVYTRLQHHDDKQFVLTFFVTKKGRLCRPFDFLFNLLFFFAFFVVKQNFYIFKQRHLLCFLSF